MFDPIYIIGQCLGIVAIALGFLSYQMKTQGGLILAQAATALVFCAHYLMIGAITGMAMNVVSAVRSIVYYYRNKKGDTGMLIPVIFAVLMGVIGILTWNAWYSVFVFCGLVINTLCMAMSDPQRVRKSILVTCPMVLTYDVFTLSIGGIVYESVAMLSAGIGLWRNRKGGAEKSDSAE